METGEMTTTVRGAGVVCPKCFWAMFYVSCPEPSRTVVRCDNRGCELLGREFEVRGPEVVLVSVAPVSSSEAT